MARSTEAANTNNVMHVLMLKEEIYSEKQVRSGLTLLCITLQKPETVPEELVVILGPGKMSLWLPLCGMPLFSIGTLINIRSRSHY